MDSISSDYAIRAKSEKSGELDFESAVDNVQAEVQKDLSMKNKGFDPSAVNLSPSVKVSSAELEPVDDQSVEEAIRDMVIKQVIKQAKANDEKLKEILDDDV